MTWWAAAMPRRRLVGVDMELLAEHDLVGGNERGGGGRAPPPS